MSEPKRVVPTHVLKKEERFEVSFSVFLTWQEKSGAMRRVIGRCVDLSSQDMSVESKDRLEPGTAVLVESREFGSLGRAAVRFCQRDQMRYVIGFRFGAAFVLGNSTRRKALELVMLRADPDAAVLGEPAQVTSAIPDV